MIHQSPSTQYIHKLYLHKVVSTNDSPSTQYIHKPQQRIYNSSRLVLRTGATEQGTLDAPKGVIVVSHTYDTSNVARPTHVLLNSNLGRCIFKHKEIKIDRAP